MALDREADFTERLQLIGSIGEYGTSISDLLELRPDDPVLLTELAKQESVGEKHAEAAELFAQARRLAEEQLAATPDDENLAGFLADVLLAAVEQDTKWTVLEPVEMSSAGGATLTHLDDGSILAGGVNPDADTYTIIGDTELSRVSAVRLEALTDDSLPSSGPGRKANGAFAMSSLVLSQSARISPDHLQEVPFAFAAADYSLSSQPILPRARWDINGGAGRARMAIFAPYNPPEARDGLRLSFRMEFNPGPSWPQSNFGRFRISVTDDPSAVHSQGNRLAALKMADP